MVNDDVDGMSYFCVVVFFPLCSLADKGKPPPKLQFKQRLWVRPVLALTVHDMLCS